MIRLLKCTAQAFNRDEAPRLAASLAFYTAFSAAPLLILIVALAGQLFGDSAAQGQVVAYLSSFLGVRSAEMIQETLLRIDEYPIRTLDMILSTGALVVGASSVVLQLQSALNKVWGLPARSGFHLARTVRRRLLAVTLVLSLAFIVITALVIDTAVPSLDQVFTEQFPGGRLFLRIINQGVSLLLIGLLFALVYKYVSDASIAWGDALIGAAVTAVLLVVGKVLIGLYLSSSLVVSIYQAGSSLMVFLIWIYYSSLVLFVGAELIKVVIHQRGENIELSAD